ncbi:hypothetical protein H4R34_000275 [Dimargaris verticillata]|uniref:CBM21 domain-containing protein n=1 Tax=Dimargaris verticillata TaxID=2761393 RepID=A0A9W8EFI9_9FUNG|nr:hypothetical protein H4R34_000275 [Dimargaris verticillata]
MSLQASPTSPLFPPDALASGFRLPSRVGRRVSLSAGAKKSTTTGSPATMVPSSARPTASTSPRIAPTAPKSAPLSVPWGKASTSPPLISALTASGCFGSTFTGSPATPAARPQPSAIRTTPATAESEVADYFSSGHLFSSQASGILTPRTALKSALRARTQSMPTSPTKSVQFKAQLQRVKLFLKCETPATVGATHEYCVSDSDDETAHSADESDRAHPTEAVLSLVNFPPVTVNLFHTRPVRLENVSLAQDKTELLGTVLVQNLAFQKTIVVRYTTDCWQTFEEVTAMYVDTTTTNSSPLDRFSFQLGLLAPQGMGTRHSLYFCVRYRVAGHEYWDNNGGANYHIQYGQQPCRVMDPQDDWTMYTRRRSSSDPTHRQTDYFFGSVHRQGPAIVAEDDDDEGKPALANRPMLMQRRPRRTSTGLAHRYDFGASLSAALQAPNATASGGRQSSAKFEPLSASATRSISQKYMNMAFVPSPTATTATAPTLVVCQPPAMSAVVGSPTPIDQPFSALNTLGLSLGDSGTAANTATSSGLSLSLSADLHGRAGVPSAALPTHVAMAADLSSSEDEVEDHKLSLPLSATAPIQIPGRPSVPGSYHACRSPSSSGSVSHTSSSSRASSSPYGHGGGLRAHSPSYNLFSVSPTFASVSPTAPCIIQG